MSTLYRTLLCLSYSLFALAGVGALVWPQPAVESASNRLTASVWGALFLIGGASSALGVLTDRWLGEFAGLLPLIAVWLVFGLAAAYAAGVGHPERLAGAAALLAVTMLLVSRWAAVLQERHAARVVAEHMNDQSARE